MTQDLLVLQRAAEQARSTYGGDNVLIHDTTSPNLFDEYGPVAVKQSSNQAVKNEAIQRYLKEYNRQNQTEFTLQDYLDNKL